MRILKVQINNIASLEGEQEIDFTQEPLLSAGLYSISGDTGSGKSTILDAICLAFYDAVPRLKSAGDRTTPDELEADAFGMDAIRSDDPRTLLRRGAVEGHAIVDFEVRQQVYRVGWSVRRSRGKEDGKLQASKCYLHRLSIAADGSEEEEVVVEAKKTAVRGAVVELVGLSFEEFSRTVILAQGEFAGFLKADASEKGQLLEKVTGTEIYSRIASAIATRKSEIEREIELIARDIAQYDLSSDEEIKAEGERLELLIKENARLKKEIESAQDAINYLEQKKTLTHNLALAEETSHKAEEALKDPSFQEQKEDLKRWDEAQSIYPLYIRRLRLDKDIEIKHKSLEGSRAMQPKCEAEYKEAEISVAKAAKALEQYQERLQELQPKLDRVERIDLLIREIEFARDNAQKRAEEQEQELQREITQARCERRQTARRALRIREQIGRKVVDVRMLDEDLNLLDQKSPAEVYLLRSQLRLAHPCPVCEQIVLELPVEHMSTGDSMKDIERQRKLLLEERKRQERILQALKRTEALTRASFQRSKQEVKKQEARLLEASDLTSPMARARHKAAVYSARSEQLRMLRSGLFDGQTLASIRSKQSEEQQQLTKQSHQSSLALQDAMSRLEKVQGESKRLEVELKAQRSEFAALQVEEANWLSERDLDEAYLVQLFDVFAPNATKARELVSRVEANLITARATLEERKEQLQKHIDKALADASPLSGIDELRQLKTLKSYELKQADEELEQLKVRAEIREQKEKRVSSLKKERETLQPVLITWQKAARDFGGADGKKFRTIAQAETLSLVVAWANYHLEKLSPRYLLKVIPGSLSLQIIDTYDSDRVRSANSLSGGESFLASLALALGLSSAISVAYKCDNLFIDEGFGSLDADALDVAITALERLEESGRSIGIISHVQTLAERIPVGIHVERRPGSSSGHISVRS